MLYSMYSNSKKSIHKCVFWKQKYTKSHGTESQAQNLSGFAGSVSKPKSTGNKVH